MGRGRAKAKQTKVARELKYSGGHLDPERLKAELAAGGTPSYAPPAGDTDDDDEEFADPYAVDDEDDASAR